MIACTMCGVPKPETLEYFPANKEKRNGLYSHCRECCSEKARLYFHKKKLDPAWRQMNNERQLRYRERRG